MRMQMGSLGLALALLGIAAGGACTNESVVGASGGGGSGGAPQQTCSSAAECDDSNPCTTPSCNSSGVCVFTPVPDGPAPNQSTADCEQTTCKSGLPTTVTSDAGTCTPFP